MDQPTPYYVLSDAEYNALRGFLVGAGWTDELINRLLEDDFDLGADGKWYGNSSTMDPYEIEFLDYECDIVFDMESYTQSQMALIMRP